MNLIRYISYLSFFSTISFAKSYSIDEVKIESVIKKNGVVEFIEKRTFNFRGKYSYVYQDIPKNYFSEIFDIQVSEEGKFYLNDNSSDPYTFQIIENKNFLGLNGSMNQSTLKNNFSYRIRYGDL